MHKQWPAETPLTLVISLIKSVKFLLLSKKNNLSYIESHFKKLFNFDIVVVPSGRSAIYHFAKCMGMSRKDTVLINKFSSYCMYQSLGPLLNVSTDYSNPDVIVVDHKWGHENLDPRQIQQKIVVEDSCDSYISSGSALFPNGGQVEIVSLSKVLGTLSGAIIIFKNSSLKQQYTANLTKNNRFHGYIQFIKKCNRIIFDKLIKTPLQGEFYNNFITKIELSMIRSVLEIYTFNFIQLKLRSDKVNEILNVKIGDRQRIGPGVVLKINSDLINFQEKSLPNGIILRHFDVSKSNGASGQFQKCLFVPIHFKIPNDMFNQYLEFIDANKSKLNLI